MATTKTMVVRNWGSTKRGIAVFDVAAKTDAEGFERFAQALHGLAGLDWSCERTNCAGFEREGWETESFVVKSDGVGAVAEAEATIRATVKAIAKTPQEKRPRMAENMSGQKRECLFGGRCYACNSRATGLRDRRPEGGDLEPACGRHRDPSILVSFCCIYCSGPVRKGSLEIDGEFAHKKCYEEVVGGKEFRGL